MDARILGSFLVSTVGLAMSLCPITARAAHVSRCDDGGGTEIYTDGSCHALGAQPAPMSAELLRSLAREGGMDGLNLAASPVDSERCQHLAQAAAAAEAAAATELERVVPKRSNRLRPAPAKEVSA